MVINVDRDGDIESYERHIATNVVGYFNNLYRWNSKKDFSTPRSSNKLSRRRKSNSAKPLPLLSLFLFLFVLPFHSGVAHVPFQRGSRGKNDGETYNWNGKATVARPTRMPGCRNTGAKLPLLSPNCHGSDIPGILFLQPEPRTALISKLSRGSCSVWSASGRVSHKRNGNSILRLHTVPRVLGRFITAAVFRSWV